MKLRKTALVIAIPILTIIIAFAGLVWWNFYAHRVPTLPPAPPSPAPPSPTGSPSAPLTSAVAQHLEIPWSLAFLPDGSIIFTERPGRVRLMDAQKGLLAEPLLTINEVSAQGEGGLLGIALHPDFAHNQFVYVYYTYQSSGRLANRVVRFRLSANTLTDSRIVLDGIPAGSIHDGGRLKFGPDGLLYITTGNSGNANLAQDKSSLAGKILRVNDDGTIPSSNPFSGSPVYSFGHRNPEGLAWDAQGRLWEMEHGSTAYDELNLIEAGKNYGWPVVRGDEKAEGMVNPVLHSGSDTWAPSGMAYLDGSLYFAGLRGQSLFRAVIGDHSVTLSRYLEGNFGRLREVVVGPDGLLYLLTSNRDGRGGPTAEDDQMIRINPSKL